jgi:hypothetical protein
MIAHSAGLSRREARAAPRTFRLLPVVHATTRHRRGIGVKQQWLRDCGEFFWLCVSEAQRTLTPTPKGATEEVKRFGPHALFMPVLFLSCATTLSPSASHVEMVPQERLGDGCSFLSNVMGSSSLTGVSRYTGFNNAVNEMIERAAQLGATHVVLDPTSEASYWTTSEIARGKAYRCAQVRGPAVRAEQVGCGKDTDCKGSRVCREGKCMDAGSGGQ